MSEEDLTVNLEKLYEMKKRIDESIDRFLKLKFKAFVDRKGLKVENNVLDAILICVKEELQNCETQKWNEESSLKLRREIKRYLKFYHLERKDKKQIVQCVPFGNGRFRVLEYDYILDSDSKTIIGILESKNSNDIRQLTSSEKKIAKGLEFSTQSMSPTC